MIAARPKFSVTPEEKPDVEVEKATLVSVANTLLTKADSVTDKDVMLAWLPASTPVEVRDAATVLAGICPCSQETELEVMAPMCD